MTMDKSGFALSNAAILVSDVLAELVSTADFPTNVTGWLASTASISI